MKINSQAKNFSYWNLNNSIEKISISNFQKKKNTKIFCDVTVGIPTYKRIYLLRRALNSLVRQNYKFFKVIISNNNPAEKNDILKICLEFKSNLRVFTLYNQKNNIGSVANLKFLLDTCDTDFFMWLADDDEISSNYIKELKGILDEDRNAVSAMGQSKLVDSKKNIEIRKQANLSSKNAINRIFSFLWYSDDSAFYGLHRTKIIKKCNFERYFWPIKEVLANYGYVILFELTLYGKTKYSRKVQWINHYCTSKHYTKPLKSVLCKIVEVIKYPIIRLNVNFFYVKKIFYVYKNISFLFLFIPVAIFCFLRDLVIFINYFIWRLTKKYRLKDNKLTLID